jgi:hypothetical protein
MSAVIDSVVMEGNRMPGMKCRHEVEIIAVPEKRPKTNINNLPLSPNFGEYHGEAPTFFEKQKNGARGGT